MAMIDLALTMTDPSIDMNEFEGASDGMPEPIAPDEFREFFGEGLSEALDLDSWQQGPDLAGLSARLDQEVSAAVELEQEAIAYIRDKIFKALSKQREAPAEAGVYEANAQMIEMALKGSLFNGEVEACDGTVVEHDTLVLTITQLGVCLVSYQGEQLSLSQRLFRRDLRIGKTGSATERARALLENRLGRAAIGVQDKTDRLSELARRGIMAYAERAVLLEQSVAAWRFGHGAVAPYELLTGGGVMSGREMPLLDASADVLRRLVLEHKRFIFVPSTISDRWLLTIGNALRPLEYAIVETSAQRIASVVENGHYAADYKEKAGQLVNEIGPNIVLGVYRASSAAPVQVFAAHPAYVHEAAIIALADSVLQEHRGFPMLIDIAHHVVNATLGNDVFQEAVRAVYAEQGTPFRFEPERATR
jgi:hypothetical protein